MGHVGSDYNYKNLGRLVFYDESTHGILDAFFPIRFEEHFMGFTFRKYTASENTTALWTTVATNLNTAPALVADEPNGVIQITLDSDDNAEHGVVYWGDELTLDMANKLIFETRLTYHVLPLTGTEIVESVFGLASANNTTLDSVATNAWFKVISSANTALLYESDDGTTDDNDNDASTVLVADTLQVVVGTSP